MNNHFSLGLKPERANVVINYPHAYFPVSEGLTDADLNGSYDNDVETLSPRAYGPLSVSATDLDFQGTLAANDWSDKRGWWAAQGANDEHFALLATNDYFTDLITEGGQTLICGQINTTASNGSVGMSTIISFGDSDVAGQSCYRLGYDRASKRVRVQAGNSGSIQTQNFAVDMVDGEDTFFAVLADFGASSGNALYAWIGGATNGLVQAANLTWNGASNLPALWNNAASHRKFVIGGSYAGGSVAATPYEHFLRRMLIVNFGSEGPSDIDSNVRNLFNSKGIPTRNI